MKRKSELVFILEHTQSIISVDFTVILLYYKQFSTVETENSIAPFRFFLENTQIMCPGICTRII